MTTPSLDTKDTGESQGFNGERPPREAAGRLLYGAFAFAALGFVLPVYSIPQLQLNHGTTDLAAGIVLYAALRLSLLIARGEPRLLETAFWTYAYSFLTLPLLAQITANQYPLATIYSYDDGTITTTEFIIIVGLIGYDAVRLVGALRFTVPTRSDSWRKRGATISVTKAALIGYVGLAFVIIAVAKHGLASFFTSRDALTQSFLGSAPVGVKFYLITNKATGTLLLALSQVPTFVGAYLLLYVRHRRRHDSEASLPSWWLIAPLVIGNIIINNPIANGRFWYGTVAIAFMTIYLPLRDRRNAARIFILAFVVISLFSFQQLAAFRRTGTTDFARHPIRTSLRTGYDYASPQQVMNGAAYIDEHGHRLGRQLLGTALTWFPKAVWADKPGDTGQLVGGAAGFKVASPLWTEGQVDWGLPGTFFYLAIVGALGTSLDRRFAQSRGRPDILAAFAPIMAGLLVFVLRGSLQPAFGSLLPVVLSVMFCISVDRSPSYAAKTSNLPPNWGARTARLLA